LSKIGHAKPLTKLLPALKQLLIQIKRLLPRVLGRSLRLIYRKRALRHSGYKQPSTFPRQVRIMDYSEECRAMARDCEEVAGDARTKPEMQHKFLSLAVRWRKLAEKFDELERPTLH